MYCINSFLSCVGLITVGLHGVDFCYWIGLQYGPSEWMWADNSPYEYDNFIQYTYNRVWLKLSTIIMMLWSLLFSDLLGAFIRTRIRFSLFCHHRILLTLPSLSSLTSQQAMAKSSLQFNDVI